ncbi:calcium-binding protein [Zavarzinia sp.]|uniref:calcium-binding protein n=1 Tax=Zavarzinia sp. TaxID=2027920 RepID=UPI003BB6E292
MNFTGTINNDSFTGTSSADLFEMAQGGTDIVNGKEGDDQFNFGATLTAADRVIGGDGYDHVTLQGDYSAGLVLASTTLRYVESFEMTSGFSYDITMSNGNLLAGEVMTVSAYGVGFGGSGHYFHFDGSAETDGSFNVSDGYGNDILIGSQGGDSLSMSYGGTDHIDGQGGGDVIMAENNFGAGDFINGGSGSDIVYFRGLQSGTIQINGGNFQNIETLAVVGDHGATFQVADTLLAAGQWLNVDMRSVLAGQTVAFLGSTETDGRFDYYDGAGDDHFTGGGGADLYRGGNGGTDIVSGLGGDDVISFGGDLDGADTIWGGAGYDTFDLTGNLSAGVHFGDDGLVGVERVVLRDGFTYKLFFADGNLNTDEGLLVSSSGNIGAGNYVYLDASAEVDASYTMYDSNGNDTLIGGGGGDVFWSLAGGKDKVVGNGGNDTFVVNGPLDANDSYNGGADIDTVSLYYATKGGVVDLSTGKISIGGVAGGSVTQIENIGGSGYADTLIGNNAANFIDGGAGNDTISGGQGNDDLRGGAGVDTLDGGAKDDILYGDAGNDTLLGGQGLDDLFGGDNTDRLDGGIGNDDLTGGAGRDTFVFATGTGVDTVKDFTNNFDYLDFTASAANSFADIQAHMSQVGADVVIAFGTDKFIIENTNIGVLDASDFLV